LDIFLGDLLGFLQFGEDRELGADQRAKAALNAVFGLEYEFRRMISLLVEALTGFQAPIWTEFDAKAASLATALDDPNATLRDGVGFCVQWQSPEFHGRLSPAHNSKPF